MSGCYNSQDEKNVITMIEKINQLEKRIYYLEDYNQMINKITYSDRAIMWIVAISISVLLLTISFCMFCQVMNV